MGYLLYLIFQCDGKFGKFGGVWGVNTALITGSRHQSHQSSIQAELLLSLFEKWLTKKFNNAFCNDYCLLVVGVRKCDILI